MNIESDTLANEIANDLIPQDTICVAYIKKSKKRCENHRKSAHFCGIHKNCSIEKDLFTLYNQPSPKSESFNNIINTVNNADQSTDCVQDVQSANVLCQINKLNKSKTKKQKPMSFDEINMAEIKKMKVYEIKDELLKKFNKISYAQKEDLQKILLKYRKFEKYIPALVKFQHHCKDAMKRAFVEKLKRFNGIELHMNNNTIIPITNESDFYTLESIEDIEEHYRFYYKDANSEKIFMNDLRSFFEFMANAEKNEIKFSNPYTQVLVDDSTKSRAKNMAKTLKEHGYPIYHKSNDDDEYFLKMSAEENVKHYAADIFHKINLLGNYTDEKWFLDLDQVKLFKLYMAMEDIWNFRAQLSLAIKKEIVPEYVLFKYLFNFKHIKDKTIQQMFILKDVSAMISTGINKDSRYLGSLLFLTALTDVSKDAAMALPAIAQGNI